MKKLFLLSFIGTFSVSMHMYAQVNMRNALKNPPSVTSLQLGADPNDAKFLMKDFQKFSNVKNVVISNVNDSITLEQDIIAIAALPGVHSITIENCEVKNISGGIKMLTNVKELNVVNCETMDPGNLFSSVAGMPAIEKFHYETSSLQSIPRSFGYLRNLKEVEVVNKDISLADGYEINNEDPSSLIASDSISLGFGDSKLQLKYSSYDETFTHEHTGIMRDMLQGMAFDGNEMKLPHRPIALNKIHPLVKEPIPGLNVVKNIYSENALTGGTIEYPSGTKIIIPENAFVDANGNTVKGDVTIDYREFRDPVDIMLSGIPMNYDSAGKKGHFVSAGMFEMNASVDGKEIFLASGKNVQMQFAVVDTARNFNFYRLDEKNGWTYQENTGSVESDNSSNALTVQLPSEAVQKFCTKMKELSKKRPRQFDPNDLDTRYNDLDYYYDQRKGTYRGFFKTKTAQQNVFRLHKNYHHKGTTCFYLERMLAHNNNNPELRAFAGVKWMTTDNLRTKEMKDLFRKRSGINDVRIYDDGDGFILELKTPKGFRKINVVPVHLLKSGPKEINERSKNSMFRRYTRALDKRKNSMTHSIQRMGKRNAGLLKELSQDSLNAWKDCKRLMNDSEANFDFAGWMDYYKNEFPKLMGNNAAFYPYGNYPNGVADAQTQQNELVYQSLSIASFGIYNCDHCGDIPDPVNVRTDFKVNDSATVATANLYLIDRDVNSATSFFPDKGGKPLVTYNKTGTNVMVIVDKKGKLFYVNENAFLDGKKMNGNTRYDAALISEKPATLEQLRNIIFGEE
ncbi:MAG: hypothetical protein HY064_15655 [Bacteroidetes bacterium]|nr:hypothetical protein [Bacteroidota bacterium]